MPLFRLKHNHSLTIKRNASNLILQRTQGHDALLALFYVSEYALLLGPQFPLLMGSCE